MQTSVNIITPDSQDIMIGGNAVKKVNQFVFLGSLVPGISADVKRRIALATVALGKLSNKFWSRKTITMKLKVRLYNALIIPIATYGSEIWALTKEDNRIIQVFENNCLRTLLGITVLDSIPLKKIYRLTGIRRTIFRHN